MLNCDFKSCGFESHYLPKLYYKKENIQLYSNINKIKKVNVSTFKFFLYNIKVSNIFLYQPIFVYFNYIFKKNQYFDKITKHNYVFMFNRSKWHYSFSLLNNSKTVFFFSLGTLLKYLKIDLKSLRRSKKGFLILLNIFLTTLKKFIQQNVSVFFNFFDHKLIFFKKKINQINFNNYLLFKISNFNNNINFKKSKSIKKRLTKKFVKRSSI